MVKTVVSWYLALLCLLGTPYKQKSMVNWIEHNTCQGTQEVGDWPVGYTLRGRVEFRAQLNFKFSALTTRPLPPPRKRLIVICRFS